jgi:CBS domain-containing protein
MLTVNVGHVCRQRVVTVCVTATLMDARQLMCEHQVDAVVVIASPVDRPTALGIITRRDVEQVELKRAADISRLRIADRLSREPLVLDRDQNIESAIRHLRRRNAPYALVLGSGGALYGLVSLDDLLNQMAA